MAAIQPIANLALELANRRSIISRRVLCGDRRLVSARCLNRTLLRRALRKAFIANNRFVRIIRIKGH